MAGTLRLFLTLAFLLGASFYVAPRCAAQTTDDAAAQAHFSAAASYYDMGSYEDALREFRVAYDLSQRPGLLYNLSLCYQQLGQLTEAADALERYLAGVEDIPNRATLTVRLSNLRERAARGETHAGDTETGAATVEPTVEAEASEAPESTETEARVAPAESLNVGAIAGFSVAAVGVIGAAVFGALTLSTNGDLSSGCGSSRTCDAGQINTLQTYALLTDISFGVALAGAAVGTILLFVGGGDSSPDTRAALGSSLHLSPLAGASSAGPTLGLVLDGSF